jgi:hypothetical protein
MGTQVPQLGTFLQVKSILSVKREAGTVQSSPLGPLRPDDEMVNDRHSAKKVKSDKVARKATAHIRTL